MKKTKYFIKKCTYSNAIQICNDIIKERDVFLNNNKETIAKVDSEELRVDPVHQTQSICILKLTYFEQ